MVAVCLVYPDKIEMKNWPKLPADLDFFIGSDGKPETAWADGGNHPLPGWIRQTENKIEVRPSLYERLQVYRKKVEIHRYEIGWKYFWFDFNSPLVDYSIWQAIGLVFSGDRVDPNQSNLSLVASEIWYNEIWLHQEVWFAMMETIFMALIGTMIASAVSLPLAFAAAKNIQPLSSVRFALRRLV